MMGIERIAKDRYQWRDVAPDGQYRGKPFGKRKLARLLRERGCDEKTLAKILSETMRGTVML